MPTPVRIWLEVAHHAAFRIGGWAYVRSIDGVVSGSAGGERKVEAERTALAGLAAAIAGLPAGAAVELHSSSPLVLGVPGRIAEAKAGGEAPADNLDLWAKATTGLGQVQLIMRQAQPGGTTAFTAAWAEFAQGRAKDRGAFSAPIPKVNLAKAGV